MLHDVEQESSIQCDEDNCVILYVDDDPRSREIMEVIVLRLMRLKHLFVFGDSTNFEERFTNLPMKPTLILLDIRMRPHNGFEVLKLLRNSLRVSDCKIIAVTTIITIQEVEPFRQAGFDGLITKPVNPRLFPTILKAILNNQPVWPA